MNERGRKAVQYLGALLYLVGHADTQRCPFYLDIDPCVCVRDETTKHLDMDCSNVVDLPELQQIFHANFPSTRYRRFTMFGTTEDPVPLTYLPDEIFGPISFQEIVIRYTKLQRIGTYAFMTSNSTLQTLVVTQSDLQSFPATILPEMSVLEDLDLSYNELSFLPDLCSTSLHDLDLAHNPDLSYTSLAFEQLPYIVNINLASCGMDKLEANLFLDKANLSTVYLEENQLTELVAGSLAFTGAAINEVILSGNKISTVEKNFASGLGTNTYLALLKNNITTLPEEVWRQVFEQLSLGQGSVLLDDNPLACGCDLAWLVTDPTLLVHLAEGATCADDTPVHDLDPQYYETNCT